MLFFCVFLPFFGLVYIMYSLGASLVLLIQLLYLSKKYNKIKLYTPSSQELLAPITKLM